MNLKKLIVIATTLFGLQAPANEVPNYFNFGTDKAIQNIAETVGLDWKVGDEANYTLDLGFIKGQMQMIVHLIGADGIWLHQNLDLGFAGKQKAEVLIDPDTGATKKIIVNGEEQKLPDPNDTEIISAVEDKITVPAGTFECIHAKLKNKSDNTEVNVWINPELVPVSGMIKQIAPSQLGQVTIVLKNYTKK